MQSRQVEHAFDTSKAGHLSPAGLTFSLLSRETGTLVANQIDNSVDLFERMLPRKRDETVFDAPWQARIFAIVTLLYESGHFSWKEFQDLLIDEIRNNGAADGSDYYDRWFAAAERLLRNLGLVDNVNDGIAAVQPHRHGQHAHREPVAVSSAREGPHSD